MALTRYLRERAFALAYGAVSWLSLEDAESDASSLVLGILDD